MSYRSAIGGNTEHAGPKKGKGAWCRKQMAKKASRRVRRVADRMSVDLPPQGRA